MQNVAKDALSSFAADKIAVGSFQGLVRVYRPEPGSFSPDHLLIEHQTGQPILQLETGRFIQGSKQLQLALLHPKEVAVYSLGSQSSDDPSGPDQSLSEPSNLYTLSPVYRNSLSRTSCNMTVGAFGRVDVGDYICVQSMDGQLSFFVHDSFAFSVFLPDFLTPGPLCYVARTDSIVTANSSRQLLSFQYQSLSVAYCGSADVGGRENAGKKPRPDWTVNLGDHVISIRIPRQLPGKPSQLLVLGERGVYCVLDTGQLRFMMKLEVSPACIYPYGVVLPSDLGERGGGGEEGEGSIQYLLATDSGQLQVFQDSALKWAAALPHPPTDISVATFQDLQGVLVTVDELGHLTCCYLGTDPSPFTAPPPSASRDLDFSQMEREVRELQKDIKTAEKGEGEMFGAEGSLVVKTEILGTPRVVDLSDSGEVEGDEEEEIKKCVDIKLTYSLSGVPVRDVTTVVSSSLPLTTHPSHLHETVVTGTPLPHTVTVVCTAHSVPAERHVTLTTTYTSSNGVTRVSSKSVELPLSLFCQPCMPAKTASHKVTLDTNKPAVSLHSLFPSLLPPSPDNAPPNAMGFRLLAGPEITIVASKSSERYRLQSETFPILGMFVEELIKKLEHHFQNKEPVFKAGYSGSLPLSDYFELLDHHYALRCDLRQCREVMQRQSLQFRAVQKRLLTRFKDKTPSGLSHLDTLLEGTYRQVMSLAEKSESLGSELRHADNLLSCATQLINALLRLSAELGQEDYATLAATLSPHVHNSDTEQGWEEIVDKAVTHMLKTTLAKSHRDQSNVSVAIQDTPLDNQRLKKHIALFCDRILKGGKLTRSDHQLKTADTPKQAGATQIIGQTEKNRQPRPEQQTRHSRKHKKPALPALAEDTLERHTEM
jgi:Bardet-Biedl syndrome 9 protein